MKFKNILIVGGAIWIGYLFYSNVKQNRDIKQLQQSVKKSKEDFELMLASLLNGGLPANNQTMPVKKPIFPSDLQKQYNTSTNGTVSLPRAEINIG